MKISKIKILPYSIDFFKPFKTSIRSYTNRQGLWLKVYFEDYVGYGEVAPMEGFNNETIKDTYYSLEGFKCAVENEFYDKEDLLSLIHIHTCDVPSARFGLETAFFDIFSKINNLSLAKYLNKNNQSEISINGISGVHFPEDGFKIIKVKVGFRNIFDEIENMHYLTEFYGPQVKFRLDLNGSLDLPKAIRFCKEMEKFNIDYIEQPVDAQQLEDSAELRYHTSIPIALDESLTDYNSVEQIIDLQAADVFIIKPMCSGGYKMSKKIIKLIKSEQLKPIVTTLLESHIGQLSCLHLASANNIIDSCGLATGGLLDENINSIKINNGVAKVPMISGLGL